MKRILIICNYYAPCNQIAAVRTTKFAKHLTAMGYDVTVLTEACSTKVKDEMLLSEVKDIPVHHISYTERCKKFESFYYSIGKKKREKLYADTDSPKRIRHNKETGKDEFLPFEMAYPFIGTCDFVVRIIKQKDLFRSAKAFLNAHKNDFDVCFSTYGGYFGHYCGLYLKKLNPRIKWIADFRDNVYNFKFNPPLTKYYSQNYERRIYESCDRITVVTKGLLNLIDPQNRSKALCLTNGYDICDRINLNNITNKDKFTFCYTGSLYGGLRKIDRLFEVLSELISEGKINKADLQFDYAGTSSDVIIAQADHAGLKDICITHGFITHDEAIRLQSQAHFLVVASWEFKAQPVGALTGKALEYMSAEKPIIALIDSDMPDNELIDVVREGNFGIGYNENNYSTDYPALKEYILMQYDHFKKSEPLEYEPNADVLERFDYRNLTKQLAELIEQK